ncbi:MAG: membrane protease YdiL (CAAX protease family) [Polaribacter sp.]|jgi:membrane protease YdiL (CAAX protease family)
MNYIQQGYKGKSDFFYWLITVLLVFFGWQILGGIPLLAVGFSYSKDLEEFTSAGLNNFMGLGIDKNLFLFLIILTSALGLLFLFISIKFVHKRTFTSLVTSRKKIDWKRFWVGFLTWGILVVIFTFVGILIEPEIYTYNFNAKPFFILVAISFFLLPLQTSFEELFLRGYFMQGIGILVKNRWVPLIITSVCFGLLHGANPEVQKLGYILMVFYIGTGFFYGITTLMDEGTELALGLHAANNVVAAFLVTTDWMVFQTDALFIDTSEPSVTLEMFLPVIVLNPLMLLFFSKKYKWTHWKEKLTGSIEKPINVEENDKILENSGTK